jgi:extracellular matrix protein 14
MRLHRAALLATLASLSVATAVPSDSNDAYRAASQPQPFLSHWRRLSERFIEKIWTQTSTHEEKESRVKASKPEEQLLPAHTLARYGGDVLLRFNISTSEEAKSLAEASDTLLLDVWEFANDWVDIRLAQELVPSLLGT